MNLEFFSTHGFEFETTDEGVGIKTYPCVGSFRRRFGSATLVTLYVSLIWLTAPSSGEFWQMLPVFLLLLFFLWGMLRFAEAHYSREFVLGPKSIRYGYYDLTPIEGEMEFVPELAIVRRTRPFLQNCVRFESGREWINIGTFASFKERALLARVANRVYPLMEIQLRRKLTSEETEWVEERLQVIFSSDPSVPSG